jgi:hypothetical protein
MITDNPVDPVVHELCTARKTLEKFSADLRVASDLKAAAGLGARL